MMGGGTKPFEVKELLSTISRHFCSALQVFWLLLAIPIHVAAPSASTGRSFQHTHSSCHWDVTTRADGCNAGLRLSSLKPAESLN